MKCAIVGAGAVGLFYGFRLQQGGEDVHFLWRSGSEEALRSGIQIVTDAGVEILPHPRGATTPEEIGPVDWVVIALKATANASWQSLLPPLLGPTTRLLTLQNGLGQEEALAAAFPGFPVYGGLCFVCLNRISPATVRHIGHGRLLLGAYEPTVAWETLPGPELTALAQSWQRSGVSAHTTPHLLEARWRKLMWNIPFNGLSIVLGGVSVDKILQDTQGSARCWRLMEETRAVANAYGCVIEPEFLQAQIDRTLPMGAYHPSSLLDFLAGRPVELGTIWEEPLRRARAVGVPVPELECLVEELRALCIVDESQKNR